MKMPAFSVVLCCVCVVASWGTGLVDAAEKFPDTPAGRLAARDGVFIIGHRGAATHAPENTLVSFQTAIKAGADVVELDYMVTSDGVQVAFHDKDLDRTTDAVKVLGKGKLTIGDVTHGELSKLDAGRWFHPRFRGANVPTLGESLDLIQESRMTMIERKTGDAADCVKLLKELDLLDKVVVQAFDWEYIAEFRRLAPGALLGTLGGDELTVDKLDAMEKTGAQLVGWNKDISAEDVQAIHDRGMKVWVYTVNSPRIARKLMEKGVDGIITDDPATMVQLRNSLR